MSSRILDLLYIKHPAISEMLIEASGDADGETEARPNELPLQLLQQQIYGLQSEIKSLTATTKIYEEEQRVSLEIIHSMQKDYGWTLLGRRSPMDEAEENFISLLKSDGSAAEVFASGDFGGVGFGTIILMRQDFVSILYHMSENMMNYAMACVAEQHMRLGVIMIYHSRFIDDQMDEFNADVDRVSKNRGLVVIPWLNENKQWVLVAVDFMAKCITYFDGSNNKLEPRLREKIRRWLMLFDGDQWTFYENGYHTLWKGKEIPIVESSCDCGIYVIMYAQHLVSGQSFTINQANMEYFRDCILTGVMRNTNTQLASYSKPRLNNQSEESVEFF